MLEEHPARFSELEISRAGGACQEGTAKTRSRPGWVKPPTPVRALAHRDPRVRPDNRAARVLYAGTSTAPSSLGSSPRSAVARAATLNGFSKTCALGTDCIASSVVPGSVSTRSLVNG